MIDGTKCTSQDIPTGVCIQGACIVSKTHCVICVVYYVHILEENLSSFFSNTVAMILYFL